VVRATDPQGRILGFLDRRVNLAILNKIKRFRR
jgi:hypothetical protein